MGTSLRGNARPRLVRTWNLQRKARPAVNKCKPRSEEKKTFVEDAK
jgi:hypothetical protein